MYIWLLISVAGTRFPRAIREPHHAVNGAAGSCLTRCSQESRTVPSISIKQAV